MSYQAEFKKLIQKRRFNETLALWEEYGTCDTVDADELAHILVLFRDSDFAPVFGRYAETALPLWEQIEHGDAADAVFSLIFDLQTTNSPSLCQLCFDWLQKRYAKDAHFDLKNRLIGLQNKTSFQGAVRNYQLLTHLNPGAFVYHKSGWGVGEVCSISLVQEQATIEFEAFSAPKNVTFDVAFSTLTPLSNTHFLSRRFGNPDALEEEARTNPVQVVTLLLESLGPKTAAEIKNEMLDLVIPETDWTAWWQAARSKLRKAPNIHYPSSTKDPFAIQHKSTSEASKLQTLIEKFSSRLEDIIALYSFVRDFPETFRQEKMRLSFNKWIEETLEKELSLDKKIVLLLIAIDAGSAQFETFFEKTLRALEIEDLLALVQKITIIAYKKRILIGAQRCFSSWQLLFCDVILNSTHSMIRDFALKSLLRAGHSDLVASQIENIKRDPSRNPEAFLWYLSKVFNKGKESIDMNKGAWLEAALELLYLLETSKNKELVKQLHNTICAKRYLLIREGVEGGSHTFLKELLLLASRCQTLSKHDYQIIQSLIGVVDKRLASSEEETDDTLWITQTGYQKLKDRITHLSEVEMVDVTEEIKKAKSHGDLRENAEYKYAVERRAQIQKELDKNLKDVQKAQIVHSGDIADSTVSFGTFFTAISGNKEIAYTVLGPWEADSEKGIISFQSKLAQAFWGKKKGEQVVFQEETYTLSSIQKAL